jgi:hypothetical protein
MARLPILAIPRPTRFLGLVSLRTATTLILFIHLVNKATGLYGILALLTGFPISPLQLSMYIYSLVVLGVSIKMSSHIQAQSAWHCLAFAQLYAVDTIINALYTVFFAAAWFLVLASKDDTTNAPGGKTIGDASGFTDPKYNVSKVEVIAEPKPGLKPGQHAVAVGTGPGTVPHGQGFFNVILQSSSMMSIFIICVFWALRVYAVFVVMAHARQTLHHHIQVSSSHNYELNSGSRSSDLAENPYEETKEEGQGWQGKLGRIMVGLAPTYWLGRNEEDELWMRSMGGKFRRSKNDEVIGLQERERRRRAGTGPPKPAPGIALGPL